MFLVNNFRFFMLCFLLSVTLTFIIIKLSPFLLKKISIIPKGPQHIHQGDVYRYGGLSIFITLFISSFNVGNINLYTNLNYLCFIISIPVFVIGFWEDLRQTVSPKFRLFGSFLSAAVFIYVLGYKISDVGFDLINSLLIYDFFSIFITLMCIVFLIQSFNIIDGLNGLSLSTGIIALISVALIANDAEDYEIFILSTSLICILAGVLLFNLPFGKIFIGDSGAYIIGLFIACNVIMLSEKNEAVTPFVVIQILIYPSYELIRSFLRRFFNNKKEIFSPDNKHLHSFLHIQGIKKNKENNYKINSIASLKIICIQIINCIYIVNFYQNDILIIIGIFVFIIIYEVVYAITKIKIEREIF